MEAGAAAARRRRPAGIALAVLAFVLMGVTACATEETPDSAPAVAGDAACPAQKVHPAGDVKRELQSGGLERSYRVHLPKDYSTQKRWPVVMVFHGGLGTGRYIQKQSLMDPVADEEGFIAVYPDGLHRTWNAGGCCEEAMRRNIDDVGFVSDMLDHMAGDFCIDPSRVYATGFSNGAMLAHRLACELPDKIAAVAPVSGVIMVPPCKPARPMSVMVFHGTDDPRSLWEGGLGAKKASKGVRESIPQTMERLYRRYSCSGEPQVVLEKGAVTCTRRSGCAGGEEVTLCAIAGGGHQWPGGEAVWPGKLGPMNTDISAAQVMWDFFERHRIENAAEPMTAAVGQKDNRSESAAGDLP